MSKILKLYNLNFLFDNEFKPFDVHGYCFYPIPEKQPKKQNIYSANHFIRSNRKMIVNSFVTLPKKQKNSIFYKNIYFNKRKIKFIDDLLIIISICIGRNVVQKSYEKHLGFPLCSGKHCEMISNNSIELKNNLEIASKQIQESKWQEKYDNGFHIIQFYNGSNVFVMEPRFLADVTIWEYLYYCNNVNLSYEELQRISLNTKIKYLIKNYLLNVINSRIPEERLRIFSDIRNQLSHHGRLPIKNPKSPYLQLGWAGCRNYIKLFKHLTQILVLKTLGIDALDNLGTFAVKPYLEELVRTGAVKHFDFLDKHAISI